jgi:hypothetical protein
MMMTFGQAVLPKSWIDGFIDRLGLASISIWMVPPIRQNGLKKSAAIRKGDPDPI